MTELRLATNQKELLGESEALLPPRTSGSWLLSGSWRDTNASRMRRASWLRRCATEVHRVERCDSQVLTNVPEWVREDAMKQAEWVAAKKKAGIALVLWHRHQEKEAKVAEEASGPQLGVVGSAQR